MKIGIFGGAFNPVHNGHIHLINTLARAKLEPDLLSVDRLLIIPTANPPHRTGDDFAKPEDRINMLRLADLDLKCEISDIEFNLEGKSYTYNTILALRKLYPLDEFYLFMGSDQLLSFDKWYRFRDVASIANVVAISRCAADSKEILNFIGKYDRLSIQLVDAAPVEVSSTEVRNRVKNGKNIDGLVPKKVEDYIKEHALYV